MKIAIANDHGGIEMKNFISNFLIKKNIEIINLGCNNNESVDYPVFANKLTDCILNKNADLGILICGTGIGISIMANRKKGIRAAVLYSDFVAEVAKAHNNANVIAFGGRTMSNDEVINRIEIFLNTKYENGRHNNRIEMLDM